MTKEYDRSEEEMKSLFPNVISTEDSAIISQAMGEALISIDVPGTGKSSFMYSVFFISVKAQERILKYGSLRKKIAMRRARIHDADAADDPFTGAIEKSDFLRELAMLRIGVPKKDRHPKAPVSPRSKIAMATYIDREGIKKDIRDLDYMALLKMAD
jgi:hypothetical protein